MEAVAPGGGLFAAEEPPQRHTAMEIPGDTSSEENDTIARRIRRRERRIAGRSKTRFSANPSSGHTLASFRRGEDGQGLELQSMG
eukprot:scaffold4412_cov401-Prasinococcus_capsulatus_cf.AAC.9